MGLLTGKNALIFGLANDKSIAWGIAQAFHREGATLGFSYAGEVLEKRVRPLAAQLGVNFVEECDVSSDEQIDAVAKKAADHFGKIDILVHSIGFANKDELSGMFYNTSRAGFHLAMDISVYSLIALTNWLIESKEYETDYKYAIGLNDELLQEGTANKDNLTETVNLQIQLEDLLKEQANSLVFTRGRGTGNLYYSTYLSTSLPVESIQPLDQGMSLSREYFRLDDPKTPITEIERGELVKVRLTVVVPAALHYIVISDPLPAGMEAVDVRDVLSGRAGP